MIVKFYNLEQTIEKLCVNSRSVFCAIDGARAFNRNLGPLIMYEWKFTKWSIDYLNNLRLCVFFSKIFTVLQLGWVNLACQMKPFLYSAILRKIRGSHSVSNFEEIIFLKFFDINFQNFGASSLAEKTNCLKVIFDPRNEFSWWNFFRKHFFFMSNFFQKWQFLGFENHKNRHFFTKSIFFLKFWNHVHPNF
jgi:hypothetical protein